MNRDIDIETRHNELCSLLIGKVFRNKHKIVVGTIVDVVIERCAHWQTLYFYAVLDNGEKINTIKMKGIG